MSRVERPTAELSLVLICGAIGAIWDSLLVNTGWIQYPSGYVISTGAPYWIVAMWMLFATTLNVALSWLQGRLFLAILFGLLGGPSAYYGAQQLGAFSLASPLIVTLTILGVYWSVACPVALSLARKWGAVTLATAELQREG